MSQDVMICVLNSTVVFDESVNLEMKKIKSCNKCLDLEAKLVKRKNMVERDVYTELSNCLAKLEKHCISIELDIQLNQQIFKKDKSCNNQNAFEILEYFENNDLKAQLQAKDTTIRKLKEHIKSIRENDKEEKVKQDMDEIETINIELEHNQFDSIEKTHALSKEQYDSLIAQLNSKSMENADLIGMFKLDLDPLAPSSTSDSRSQPTGNKKNDRISQTPSSNMKNKVEVQLRRANLSSNKKNRVKDPICDVNVKHTMLNANSELICVKCKQCMFDANHDVSFIDFVNDVNVRSKSKSAKQSQQHNIWKPTGKVFIEIGYKWKPTRKLFTLVGNSCPLTRIISIKVMPIKEPTSHSVETQKP
ncbi:hypothetical protein Tco_1317058 [Tanacetum coccineum]